MIHLQWMTNIVVLKLNDYGKLEWGEQIKSDTPH